MWVGVREPKYSYTSAGTNSSLRVAIYLFTNLTMKPQQWVVVNLT